MAGAVARPPCHHQASSSGFAGLLGKGRRDTLRYVKTLTVEEAVAGLDRWVERALAGEQIRIRQGDTVVELRPARLAQSPGADELSPREGLRRLQADARLSQDQL